MKKTVVFCILKVIAAATLGGITGAVALSLHNLWLTNLSVQVLYPGAFDIPLPMSAFRYSGSSFLIKPMVIGSILGALTGCALALYKQNPTATQWVCVIGGGCIALPLFLQGMWGLASSFSIALSKEFLQLLPLIAVQFLYALFNAAVLWGVFLIYWGIRLSRQKAHSE